MADVDALLLDIDGVLAVSWEPIPGAIDALASFRRDGMPFRLITNTTTHTRDDLASLLRDAGFDVGADEIVTAVTATASFLRAHHPDAGVAVLSDGDAAADLEGVRLVDVGGADVIVIGGASDDFTYAAMNGIFRRLMDGASLVGMHRNLYWRTAGGWQLDGGAYIAGLEEATGATATICGKPAAAYFEAALDMLGVPAPRVAMVGDDIVNDIGGAQELGIHGVLVRTGKFRDDDVVRGAPDTILGSLADVPAWLRS
ncbi:MAG TPA: HAD-IIA family hydrolase [Actinomycetota bacterium]|nr:HAD-IIA family hydrolase [Actinomycetota bacterium]